MIRRHVILSPEALDDLDAIDQWITNAASLTTATRYLGRVRDYLAGFDFASERGAKHDDLIPGLRTIGFERRLTIAFSVSELGVTILRVFRAGEDWRSAF
ncbi:type II toxin-antitoxin system RelE/ParE family toxin [Phenylobacterium sp.]|uniref:type II toxin-antitoxin system RelE/ParE family toxin n=1 Tax=Phenylobacterium sp. TaxID=1871053 RepID=UPI003D2C82E0